MNAHKKIEVSEYNPEWPVVFEQEKSAILNVLADNCIAIHHIGSTSVPGLIAKPKIDIIAIANDRQQCLSALEKIGYQYDGEWNIPLQCGFAKRVGFHVNLHVFFEKDHPEVELNLAFRDYLRKHEDARIAYGNLKREILKNEENATKYVRVGNLWFPFYTLQKRSFIDDILRTIGFNRLRVLKCLTDLEQDRARQFYAQEFGEEASIDFSDENYEHFMLYSGVEICGYAKIQISPKAKIVFIKTQVPENETFFRETIQKWINVR